MSKKALSKEQKRANEMKQVTFTPKSYKELVDWFYGEIVSGTAQKRDFLKKAEGLKAAEKAAVSKKEAEKAAEKK